MTTLIARRAARPALFLSRRVSLWTALARQRAALARLDDTALRDVGLSPEDARIEAARPFWDAPAHWCK